MLRSWNAKHIQTHRKQWMCSEYLYPPISSHHPSTGLPKHLNMWFEYRRSINTQWIRHNSTNALWVCSSPGTGLLISGSCQIIWHGYKHWESVMLTVLHTTYQPLHQQRVTHITYPNNLTCLRFRILRINLCINNALHLININLTIIYQHKSIGIPCGINFYDKLSVC